MSHKRKHACAQKGSYKSVRELQKDLRRALKKVYKLLVECEKNKLDQPWCAAFVRWHSETDKKPNV